MRDATPTEEMTGLDDEIVEGLRQGLDLFQQMIDKELREGADSRILYAPGSRCSHVRAAQTWLAVVAHKIHLEHVAMEERPR